MQRSVVFKVVQKKVTVIFIMKTWKYACEGHFTRDNFWGHFLRKFINIFADYQLNSDGYCMGVDAINNCQVVCSQQLLKETDNKKPISFIQHSKDSWMCEALIS